MACECTGISLANGTMFDDYVYYVLGKYVGPSMTDSSMAMARCVDIGTLRWNGLDPASYG